MFTRLLFAAPKRRTSHSVKRKRQATKAIKNIEHTHCGVCGFATLRHCGCRNCFESFKLKEF